MLDSFTYRGLPQLDGPATTEQLQEFTAHAAALNDYLDQHSWHWTYMKFDPQVRLLYLLLRTDTIRFYCATGTDDLVFWTGAPDLVPYATEDAARNAAIVISGESEVRFMSPPVCTYVRVYLQSIGNGGYTIYHIRAAHTDH